MSDDDIDYDRVVVDPDYRRLVIDFLNCSPKNEGSAGSGGLAMVAADESDHAIG